MTCIDCKRPLFDGEKGRCDACRSRRTLSEESYGRSPNEPYLDEDMSRYLSDRSRGYA